MSNSLPQAILDSSAVNVLVRLMLDLSAVNVLVRLMLDLSAVNGLVRLMLDRSVVNVLVWLMLDRSGVHVQRFELAVLMDGEGGRASTHRLSFKSINSFHALDTPLHFPRVSVSKYRKIL